MVATLAKKSRPALSRRPAPWLMSERGCAVCVHNKSNCFEKVCAPLLWLSGCANSGPSSTVLLTSNQADLSAPSAVVRVSSAACSPEISGASHVAASAAVKTIRDLGNTTGNLTVSTQFESALNRHAVTAELAAYGAASGSPRRLLGTKSFLSK